MNAKKSSLLNLFVFCSLAILLCGCNSLGTSSAEAFSDTSAEGTVLSFYDWYMEYAGNPLVEHAYQTNPVLATDFIHQVDERLSSQTRGGYDPFLCAQDRPGRFSILSDSQTVDGTGALVLVHEVWNPDSEFEFTKDIKIKLENYDGHWQITGIDCEGGTTVSKSIRINPVHELPEEVVQAFYDWYLAYFRDPVTHEFRNPIGEAVYRTSVYLSADFVQRLDDLIASNQDKYGFMPADPFICAQDIPEYIQVEDTTVVSGREAHFVVGSSFPNHHFTVDLLQIDGEWRIDDIHCHP